MHWNAKINDITLGDAKGLQAQEGSKLKAPGRAKGAKKALERARAIDPANIDAMQWLIEYYLQAPGIAGGSKEKAKATADEIIKLDEARGHTSWARIHEYLGDLDQARIAAQKAIDADPDNRARRYQYARICYEQKNYDDAEAVYVAVVNENPDDPKAHVALGDGYRILERWDDAEAAYRVAIELEPDNIDARKNLGYLYQNEKVKRWDDAIAEFEMILELDPTRADALYQIGKTCVLSETQLERGEKCFKDYLNARVKGWWPQPADAHWRLAMIYDLEGEIDKAEAELRTARDINPNHKASKSMQSELKKQKRRGKR
jgi:tetratricopeptide (TPR) repeat protein